LIHNFSLDQNVWSRYSLDTSRRESWGTREHHSWTVILTLARFTFLFLESKKLKAKEGNTKREQVQENGGERERPKRVKL
jgi:hypothetical protein